MNISFWLGSPQYGCRAWIGKRLGRYIIALMLAIAPVTASGEQLTIAAFGDSLTQGYGLPQGDGLVPQLESWLREQGADVSLLNAGVSGDTTAGGKSRIDWTLTPDIDAIIVNLGGNDILRGLPPETARQNLVAILEAIRTRDIPVLLVGIEAPSNFGPEFKQGYDSMYPELAAQYGALLYPSYLAALTEGADRAEVLKTLMQPDAIHPNAEGVKRIVTAIGPLVLELIERSNPNE